MLETTDRLLEKHWRTHANTSVRLQLNLQLDFALRLHCSWFHLVFLPLLTSTTPSSLMFDVTGLETLCFQQKVALLRGWDLSLTSHQKWRNVAASNLQSQLFKVQLVVFDSCFFVVTWWTRRSEVMNYSLIKSGFCSLMFSPLDQTHSEVPSN